MTDAAPVHDAAALTRHIETRYHQPHREALPRLAEMAEKVESVHEGDPDDPRGLSDILRRMIDEMEVHMKKEELTLFPAIRRGGGPGVETPIAEIRRLNRDLTLPGGACRTWTALYEGLEAFTGELSEHIRLENEVLFPQFEPGARADV